jgi:hypothetical protein
MEWQTLGQVSPAALADGRAELQRAARALGAAPLEWDAGRAVLIGQETAAGERLELPVADELARWYADADLLLRDVADREPGLGPIRVWPPELDIAAVLREGGGAAREGDRQIRFGLSLGNQHHPEPHFYLAPSPIEVDVTFPPLPSGGRWQRAGFIGAILLAGDLLQGPPDGQQRRARAWLEAALATGRHLIAARR